MTRPPRRGGERGGEEREGRVGVNNSAELLSRLFVKRCQKRLRTRGVLGGVEGNVAGGRAQSIWSTRDSAQQLSSLAPLTLKRETRSDSSLTQNQSSTPGFKYLLKSSLFGVFGEKFQRLTLVQRDETPEKLSQDILPHKNIILSNIILKNSISDPF